MTEELSDTIAIKLEVEVKMNKNLKKRLKKKAKKVDKEMKLKVKLEMSSDRENDSGIDIDVDYIPEALELGEEFSIIVEKYNLQTHKSELEDNDLKPTSDQQMLKVSTFEEDGEEEKFDKKISNKKMKKLTRLTLPQLKQLVSRPDLVEVHDVTARDPKLLILLKSARNCVPVPRHWSSKSKYLQRKRCIERAQFHLPDNIKSTGIMEMRQSLHEQMEAKTLKSKMKEKIRPKMNKLTIDYQVLQDAFFKFQTKPSLTKHGDLYYEGKEFETKYRHKKPGIIPDVLREALGIPTGYGAEKCPPPWLSKMQARGPPPAFPNLKVPGVNAPPPEGCEYGNHPGGWGQAPVDRDTKMPVYVGAFGDGADEFQFEEVDKSTLWGVMGEKDSDNEFDEEEEEEEKQVQKTEEEEKDKNDLETSEELETASGVESVVPACFETPDSIELRKKRIEDEMNECEERPLYTVLPERPSKVGKQIMGSTRIYDTDGISRPGIKLKKNDTVVALDPDELDNEAAIKAKVTEESIKMSEHPLQEDMSQMVIEHATSKNQKKRKRDNNDGRAKKSKIF